MPSLVPALLLAAAAPAGTLTIDVANVRNGAGAVHVDLCPQARFLKEDCPYSATVPARAGTTTVTLRNLPAGAFAVQAFHDEDGDGAVDRGLFGIPKEGIGFSRDAPIRLGPPKWHDAVLALDGTPQRIRLGLRYFGRPNPAR